MANTKKVHLEVLLVVDELGTSRGIRLAGFQQLLRNHWRSAKEYTDSPSLKLLRFGSEDMGNVRAGEGGTREESREGSVAFLGVGRLCHRFLHWASIREEVYSEILPSPALMFPVKNK